MNKKLLSIIILVIAVVVIGIFFANRGIKGPGERPEVTTSEEQEGREWKKGDAIEECNVGTWATVSGVTHKVTGIEKHSIEGQMVDLCCSEMSGEGQKQKYCVDMMYDVEYAITWMANEETGGKLVKIAEIYSKDGQRCVKAFDVEGNVAMEMCD